ncbi:MAG TPA: immune inhibitor A domain-containing protein, partial [Actinomycetota bacterium]|nr:immune inhibitor A domain-containing protein [Actinomycetota bacterium]
MAQRRATVRDRALRIASALAVAAALFPGTAPARQATHARYDIDRFREAAAAAVTRVGAPPAAAASYFDDHTFSFAHTGEDPVTLSQPDGHRFRVRQRPASDGGGLETVEGELVVRGDDEIWRYARWGETTRLVATDAVVGRDPAPPVSHATRYSPAMKKALTEDAVRREEMRRYTATRARAVADAAAAAGEPVVLRIPVLLFKINNRDFLPGTTPASVEALIDGHGTSMHGTLAELYEEQSHGRLILEFDVFGPYDVSVSNNPQNDCWYGTLGGPVFGDVLGIGGLGAKGMAQEVVPQADPDVDFSRYDNDGDGYVDFTAIMHSGTAYEVTGSWCDVWSHYWSGFGPPAGLPPDPTLTTDGVVVGSVLTVPEVAPFTGVFGHEIMHALGEPDYYGTQGTSGTGDWDLGAGGGYLGQPSQSNPAHLNPVVKINMGWVEPEIVDATTYDVEIRARATHPDAVAIPLTVEPAGTRADQLCGAQAIGGFPEQNRRFRQPNGDCIVEGLLIEHVSQSAGRYETAPGGDCRFVPAHFDRQVYASGLAVWHFDFRSYTQLGNNNLGRPMLWLVEFDRRDDTQEIRSGVTRGEPTDLYWGDPVGISTATGSRVGAIAPPPPGSPYTASAPLPGAAQQTPDWTVPPEADSQTMTLTLTWDTQNLDDWDLHLYKEVESDGETYWEEVNAAAGPGARGPEVVDHPVAAGEKYFALARNWASVSPEARIEVVYGARGSGSKASTLTNNGVGLGWQITGMSSPSSSGTAHAAQRPGEPITLDIVRHDGTTVDVSPDFLTPAGGAVPVIAGKPIEMSTRLYNHGGKAVDQATISLFGVDPSTPGATPLSTVTRSLSAFDRQDVTFTFKAAAGTRTYYVRTVAAGDVHPSNDVVATEISADPASANVLVVDADRGFTFEEPVEAVLQGLGVPYHVVRGIPTLTTLRAYPLVVWLTTSVSGPDGIFHYSSHEALWDYLAGGGRVWMQSTRALATSWIFPEFFGIGSSWFAPDSQGRALPKSATTLPAIDLGTL